ncbi:MAG: hypothetical protein JEZ00_17330 [Anaerolineaceae bacterium]|nr:hypothetical protein [Anaerolineaceae bacterium]
MITDPNWLLSTIVQSTAAFVAIVAGFVINRLLALSAERNSLQIKIRDIKLVFDINKQNLENLENQLLDWDARDFLEDSDVLEMLIESGGQISLADILKQVSDINRSEDDLRQYWEEAVIVTKEAVQLMRENFSKLIEQDDDIDIFFRNLGIDLSSYRKKIYKHAYYHFLNEYNERQNPYGLVSSYVVSQAVNMPDLRTIDEDNRYRTIENEIEFFKREKHSQEIQLNDLEAQLKQLGQPKGLVLGIIFLAYFSVVGILIPVYLLPFPVEEFTPIYKNIIFSLFFSGLVFFFTYLIILFRQLSNTQNNDNSESKKIYETRERYMGILNNAPDVEPEDEDRL